MADITDPQLVAFANERARVMADLCHKHYRTCKQFLTELTTIEGLAAYTGAANGDVFADGSATDGRNQVTKLDLAELKDVIVSQIADMESTDEVARVAQWSVNSQPSF